jgi:hypothetical protein
MGEHTAVAEPGDSGDLIALEWASAGNTDFNRDLGFTHTEEELRPFLEGEIPTAVKQNAESSGTEIAGYVTLANSPTAEPARDTSGKPR